MGGRVLAVWGMTLAVSAPAVAHVGDAPGDRSGRAAGQPIATPAEPLHSAYIQRPVAASAAATQAQANDEPQPTPGASCGPGSNPSPDGGMSGRVPAEAVASGKADNGFWCNATLLGREGDSGGFKVERFVDKAGRECAYYDTTLLFPVNPAQPSDAGTGVAVLDMSDPSKPVRTESLLTPAMASPHESVLVNQTRGLLAAVLGNPSTYPGTVDIYDLNEDCRHPVLQSSLPVGVLGHESGFAPDGNTFYATSLFTGTITAIDVTEPRAPRPIWEGVYISHGLTVSDDGNRAYLAADFGLLILDTSEIQARKPNPQVREVGRLTWKRLSVPQVAHPVTINGKPYLVEVDEFSTNGDRLPANNGRDVGAARIIDISDETKPRVVSNLRLDVHQEQNREGIEGDPGAAGGSGNVQGYAGHYCNVPRRVDPGIVACSFIASGLRVFDIRDPEKPREIAYYVAPFGENGGPSNWAMSGPAFNLERREVWYSDGNSGFYALRINEPDWPLSVKGEVKRGCTDRRSFRFRLHADRGSRIVRAVVYLGKRRVLTRRGKRLRTIAIDPPGRRRFVLKIVTRQANGVRRISRRTYTGCRKGKPRTRRIAPP